MKLTDLIQELTAADIRLWVTQGQLRFSAPAGAMSAQRKAWIRAHKTALVDFLSQANRESIPPAPDDQPAQLSCAQERLWFTQQLEGSSGLYNEGRALCIRGPLNKTALREALQHIAQRHQVLRSSFYEEDSKPQLAVAPTVTIRFCETDLSAAELPLAARQQQALDLLSAESQRPFDLTQAPLARFPLVRIADDAYVLGVFMHHLICDGLSLAVLFEELTTAYTAYCRGEQPLLNELPIQYSDFAHWQRLRADHLAPQRDLHFWRRKLRGLSRMRLGDGGGNPQLSVGRVHRFQLSAGLLQRLDALAGQHGVSRFVLFSAVYQILLSACAERNEVSFSTPITERQHTELQGLIGLFVNSLMLRQSIPGALAFTELLGYTRDTVNEARSHQQAPFERVVDAVAANESDRQAVTSALSQARLVYLENIAQHLDFHDLQVRPFAVNRRLAKFDLMLTVERGHRDDAQHCVCDFEYKTALFTAEYVEQLAQAFQQLLEIIAAKPYCSVNELRQRVQSHLCSWRQACEEQRRNERRSSLRSLRRRAAG